MPVRSVPRNDEVSHAVLARAVRESVAVLGRDTSDQGPDESRIRVAFAAAIARSLGVERSLGSLELLAPVMIDDALVDVMTDPLDGSGLGEIVSSIGTTAIGRVDEVLIAQLGESASARDRRGVVYTPRALARRVVDLVLGPLVERARDQDAVLSLRVLDPSCGSGVFLLEANKP